jgi:hypothetical protein
VAESGCGVATATSKRWIMKSKPWWWNAESLARIAFLLFLILVAQWVAFRLATLVTF